MKRLIVTTLHSLLVLVIVANTVLVTPVSAQNLPASPDLSKGMTLGSPDDFNNGTLSQTIPASTVPDFASQLAAQQQAQPVAAVPLLLKVSTTPAIYLPGHSITLNWLVAGQAQNPGKKLEIVINTPPGISPIDSAQHRAISQTAQGGQLTIQANDGGGRIEWKVEASAKFPLIFHLTLRADGADVDDATALIDTGKYDLGAGGGMVASKDGGVIETESGGVKIVVPAGAVKQPLLLDVRNPSPQQLPAVSLTGYPIEIVAVGKTNGQDVKHFDQPITIQVQYDPAKLIKPHSEASLMLYYYNPDDSDWYPLPTTVDTVSHTLTAQSDHLTVFDYKAGNWQTNSLPTVDSFKVSDFTGAATYGLSLWTPPGPGGLKADVTLNYNSQVIDESMAFSQASWVGMGWSLETGAITRNMHDTDGDLTDDTFNISAGGVSGLLLPIGHGSSSLITDYNTADQSFAKVQFNSSNNTWTVWDRNGVKYIFKQTARTAQSTNCAKSDAELNLTWKWSLLSITDISGNRLNYAYNTEQKTPGACLNEVSVYPTTITYLPKNLADSDGKYRIRFETGGRKDFQSSWANKDGRSLFSTLKLNKVWVEYIQPNQTVWTKIRQYVFTYASNSNSNRIYPNFSWSAGDKTLTLLGVQEKSGTANDQCSVAGTCLPAVSFTYGDNEHITKFDNGQGGVVTVAYDKWQYADDVNDRLRSLFIHYGDDECKWNSKKNQWDIGTGWVPLEKNTAGCFYGTKNHELLQIGLDWTDPLGVIHKTPATVERSTIPENVLKPGGHYRLSLDGMSIRGQSKVSWIMKDSSNNATIHRDWNVNLNVQNGAQTPYTFADESIDLPYTYNPATTKFQIYCDGCWLKKIQFAIMPTWNRVSVRTVTDTVTGRTSTFHYQYDHPASNTVTASASAAKANGNWDNLYTPILREYRGNAMTQMVDPNSGLTNLTWYAQSDVLKGRALHTLTIDQTMYDGFNDASLDTTAWKPVGSNSQSDGQGISAVSGGATWPVSLTHIQPTLVSGRVAVAAFQLSGANPQGEWGLVSKDGQFFGVVVKPQNGKEVAYLRHGADSSFSGMTPLIANFKLDTLYVLEIFVDNINGFRLRLWEDGDPSISSEQLVRNVPIEAWKFRQRVNGGTSGTAARAKLDAYLEGVPYSESHTIYKPITQYSNTQLLKDSKVDLSNYLDLAITWVSQTISEQRSYNGGSDFAGTQNENQYLPIEQGGTQYGNPTRQIASAWKPDTISTIGGSWVVDHAMKTTYIPDVSKNNLGLVDRQIMLDCASGCNFANENGKVAESLYSYDSADRPTTKRTWVGGANYIQTSTHYDGYGNLDKQASYTTYVSADSNSILNISLGQTTTTKYDPTYHTYPIEVTDAVGHHTYMDYDYSIGALNLVTNLSAGPEDRASAIATTNKAKTSASYDLFGRMVSICAPYDCDPNSGGAGPTLKIQYFEYASKNAPMHVLLTQKINNNDSIRLARFYDGLGKQIQTQTVGAMVNGLPKNIVVGYQYDGIGRPSKQSVPTPVAFSAAPNLLPVDFSQPSSISSTSYDILSRVTSTVQPNGNTVSTAYALAPAGTARGFTTTVLDAKKQKTTSIADVWGRTLSVTPPTGPILVYGYDVQGQLTSATQKSPTGQTITTTTIDYDRAGRKIHMSDPDMGHWYYSYNGASNMVAQIDAKLQAVNLYYDALNRLVGKTYTPSVPGSPASYMPIPDNGPYTINYTYDSTANDNQGIGHRTSMTDPSGATAWVYDLRGRVVSEKKDIKDESNGQKSFTTGWAYNSADLPVTMTYPDNEALTYTYDSAGNLQSLKNQSGQVYAQGMKYDEATRLTSMILGNNIINRSFSYYPWSEPGGGLLKSLSASSASAPVLQSLTYDYDKNGNVLSIKDTQAGPQTQSFTYDALNRLTTARATGGTGGTYSEGYHYNGNTGNLDSKAGITYTFDPAHPHAVSSLSNGKSYQYDLDGNMILRTEIDRSAFQFIYDTENHLISVTKQPAPTGTPNQTQTAAAALFTPTGTPSATEMLTPSLTPSATLTATETPFASSSPTDTPTVTETETPTSTSTPTPIPLAAISAGNGYSCGIVDASHAAKCWGDNTSGQLGDGSTTQHEMPMDVSGLSSNVNAIVSGQAHTCVLASGGVVKCWGDNSYGQLGDGTTTQHNTPVDVNGLTSGATAITLGQVHTCAITSLGGVQCWGQNVNGQLGDGTTIQRNTPVDVSGLTSGATAIASGFYHTCALTTDGAVKCWGNNNYGQLGDGTNSPSNIPVDVSGLSSGVIAIAAGSFTTCAILNGGALKCWGQNSLGQLGDNSTTNSNTPVDVNGLNSGVVAVALGGFTTCALVNDALKCWGFNSNGQLGDGTTNPSSVPLDVNGMSSGVSAIAVGSGHICALMSGGALKCWGNNGHGQLGDGTTTDRSTPVDVVWPTATPTITPPWTATPTETILTLTATSTTDVSTSTKTPTPTVSPTLTQTLTPTTTPTRTWTSTATSLFRPTPTLATFTGVTYLYDGDGTMVKSSVNGVISYFPSKMYNLVNDVICKYYIAGSQAIAINKGGVLNYMLSDQLGSSSLTTNANGQLIAEMRYKAFGETRYVNGTTPTDYRYTSQREQRDIGLYYYGARWYDPIIGRFAQADSVVPQGAQGLDRYVYANNNPIMYTDPTGHQGDCSQIPNTSARTACENANQQELNYWQNQTDVVIGICGDDMYGQCLPAGKRDYAGWNYPNGVRPLTPYRQWASQNGVAYFDFATAGCGSPGGNCQSLTDQIAQTISTIAKMNPNINFTIVGFSGGGASTITVAEAATTTGGVAYNKVRIVQLDALIPGSNHNDYYAFQQRIDSLKAKGVQIVAFNSDQYLDAQIHYKYLGWLRLDLGWLGGRDNITFGQHLPLPADSWSVGRDASNTYITHQMLSIDETAFIYFKGIMMGGWKVVP